MEIKIGDTVVLLCGGSPMKVIDIGRETGGIFCEWDMGDDEIGNHVYHPALLKVVAPELALFAKSRPFRRERRPQRSLRWRWRFRG